MSRKTPDIAAVATRFIATPHQGWRSRVSDFTPLIGATNQAHLEQVRDVVYGMVLETGADLKTICTYFGWDINTARSQIGPVIDMAKAELKLAVQKNQLDFAMSSKQPLAKIHIGRQFADQTEHAVLLDGDGEGSGLIVAVVKANRDQSTGRTLGEASSEVVRADA